MHFSYHNPTKILFGQQQISNIAQEIPLDKKVIVLYGGGSIKSNGVYQQVEQALSDHQWIEFSGIEPNPTKETLDKAVALIKEQQADYILAVGGGSVIDGSKYVAASALYQGDGWDILTGDYQIDDALPIGAVLTIPATGSESNAGAVITNKALQTKLPFFSPKVQPQFAVLDPDTMKTLPQRQLANGVIDAWVHTCEQFITYPAGAMVQDGYALALLKALKQLADNFEQQDDQWRANLMWAANQALNGLIGSGVAQDWATHMIGHELTALWGTDHARSLSMIQPSLLRVTLESKKDKLELLGKEVFGLADADDLAEQTINAIEKLYLSLDMPIRVADYDTDQAQAIDNVLKQLKAHNMTALGEHSRIDLDVSKRILDLAFAD
ncbi:MULTISPECIES: iron-containing alcohol dehydrogenase [unclassified Vibrio]|uniref:Iron-containing alcohol dehydrogenase n=1 Tax=Vibrio sp. HB236076 TaxID=3232307 RepID=A0AB39HHW8_9VIBR|nr:iron-containing alcohol dehydrogenase [Vibrio sp. HB161653]MDP5253047.1 iron-containing alcohol dehydrogenase [Vibrio sp. HB161653]